MNMKNGETQRMNAVIRPLSLGALLLIAGCGSAPPPPPPTIVTLDFTASADVNPDPSGRPSSVNLRYYQLGATSAFEKADYFQLHDKEPALLGKDLLDQQDELLAPGATKSVTIEGKPGVKSLGIAASFRNIDQATWRADVPIPPNKTTKFKVELSKLKVSIEPEGGSPQ
jgi:type VI secretion system protein VasD